VDQDHLIYAREGHPEYLRELVSDTLIVTAEPGA
jgi:hypothetical protein